MLHPFRSSYLTPGGQVYRPFLDLASRPHLLIAGATGSGKSVALSGIVQSLLMTESPYSVQFVLLDPKKVELIRYQPFPHVLRYSSEHADMLRSLQWCLDETDRRFTAMQRARSLEYDGAHLYIIIDELADLMLTNKIEYLPLLQRLAQIGRAARVHVIACSQNIMAQTIPTVLKCNFTTVLGLRTANKQQSRYLISEVGCESLPDPKREGKGFGYVRDGADLYKLMIYMYPDSVLTNLLTWWTTSACIERGA